MWDGGCNNGESTQSQNFYGNWTVDTCLAKTKSITWGTGFFINTDTKACLVFSDGCIKAPSS